MLGAAVRTLVVPVDVLCVFVLPPALNASMCCGMCCLMLLGVRRHMVEEKILPVGVPCMACEEPSRFGKMFLKCAEDTGPGSTGCEAHLLAQKEYEEAKRALREAMAKLRKVGDMFRALIKRCMGLYGDLSRFFGSFSFNLSLDFSWIGLPNIKLPSCGVDLSLLGMGRVDPCTSLNDGLNTIIGGIGAALQAVGKAISATMATLLRPLTDIIAFVRKYVKKLFNRLMDALAELRSLGSLLGQMKDFIGLLKRLDPMALAYDLLVEPLGQAVQGMAPFMSLVDSLRCVAVLLVLVVVLCLTGVLAVYGTSAYMSVVALLL